jgi:5-formyltetrahydrofolate cyclo-ligase
MNKAELRQQYLAKQKVLSADEVDSASKRIAENFFSGCDLEAVRVLHCFIPIEKFNEINTRLIFAKLWRDFPHIQTVVPRVDRKIDGIRSLVFTHETELVRNAWGIEEPADDEFVEAQRIDLVLVPGLCFDKQGHRVGFGKGYYDRFLKTCRPDCLKIGLSHFEPIDKIDDVHDGDVRLDAVITPDGMRNAERGMRNSIE